MRIVASWFAGCTLRTVRKRCLSSSLFWPQRVLDKALNDCLNNTQNKVSNSGCVSWLLGVIQIAHSKEMSKQQKPQNPRTVLRTGCRENTANVRGILQIKIALRTTPLKAWKNMFFSRMCFLNKPKTFSLYMMVCTSHQATFFSIIYAIQIWKCDSATPPTIF